METSYVESTKTGIIYESDLPIFEHLEKNRDFIEFPELIISKDVSNVDYDYVLRYNDSNLKKIDFYNNKLVINYPINEVNCDSIIYPGYLLIEKKRVKTKEVSCHAACISKDNKAILLLGRSGSGKTCLLLNLCIKYGYHIIANDKVILKDDADKLLATGGTKFIFLRYESIKRNLSYLLDVFDNKKVDSNYVLNKKIDTWRKKVRVLPQELGIVNDMNNVEIVKAYMLHVDENQDELCHSLDTSLVSKMFLNEILSENIRGVKTTFLDKNNNPSLYIPSMDTSEHYKFRRQIISKIINDCQLEYISGNLTDVSNEIDNNFKLIRRIK